jgi:hypothetical protein
LDSTVEQWDLFELSLRSETNVGNPFTDVNVEAEMSCDGMRLHVAGFYDGDNIWRIRVMPTCPGTWSFVTHSSVPELDGINGSFEVVAATGPNHGPVRILSEHHFEYSDGAPYFMLGTTLYNWLNRDEELEEETLAALAGSPFTKVRFGFFPKWFMYNRVEPARFPYAQGNDGALDLDRFDPGFFRHVERRILDLQRLSIEADIILFHPYDRWGFASMTPDRDDAYLRYVAARLSAFRNVWWTMCNEYNLFHSVGWPGMHLESKDWDRMFGVLVDSDPYQHLRGMHNAGAWYDHSKPWITHVVAQESRHLPALTRKGRAYQKPVVIDEFGYEGNTGYEWGDLTGHEAVRRHWEVTMAGGYASHGETYVHDGGTLWWSSGGTLVGESPPRLAFLRRLLTHFRFEEFAPATDCVQGGSALVSSAGDRYLFFFASVTDGPLQVLLDRVGSYLVELIDPWQMTRTMIGSVASAAHAFLPPFVPCLLYVARTDGMDAPDSLARLLAEYVGEPSAAQVFPRPFCASAESFSVTWPIGHLLADPRARAILEQHIPEVVDTVQAVSVLGAVRLEALALENRGEAAGLVPVDKLVVSLRELAAIDAELKTVAA